MINAAEIRNNLAGAWALMNNRADGLKLLDTSVDGFWGSFGAILLIVPFAIVAVIGERTLMMPAEGAEPLSGALFARHALLLVADWIAFPLVFAALARPLGLSRNYVPFIVARNWGAVITTAIASIAYGLIFTGIVPAGAAPLLLVFVLGLALRFSYCIARTTLGVPPGVAIPIVVLDLLLSLILEGIFGG
jgi:hypothetical protein